MFLCANKSDMSEQRQIKSEEVISVAQNFNILSFEVSAKDGSNVPRLFFNSVSLLPVFDDYSGSKEEIVNQLENENAERNNYLEHSSYHSNSGGVSMDSAKARELDQNMSTSKDKDFSIKIADSEGQKEYQNFQKRKNCKC